MAGFPNRTKEKLRANQLALGFGVHHLRTSATALLAAACDHDWLFIDMEHGAFSVHEASQICLAALPTGVTPIVRVAADALDEATRALDNGAHGIVVPHVDTVAQAQRIARAFRYPPLGARSWGGPPAVLKFQPPGNAEAQALLNDAILVVVMIGTSDLSAEMGISGQIGHERVKQAYQTVAAACRANGKALGMGGVYDSEMASRYINDGARFVLGGTDHSYLLAGAQARAQALREFL